MTVHPRIHELPPRSGAAEPARDPLWPTPAQELLLRAATMRGAPALAAWREWRATHDVVESEIDHGSFRLLPLAYRNLVANGGDDPEMPRLKGVYRYWWCHNQSLFYQAAELLKHLHAAGVHTLMLKGVNLSLVYYDDPGVRPMADVDVLVPWSQVHAAVACLAALGWRDATGQIAEEIRYRHSTPMVNGGGQEFDLHWHALREGLRDDSDDGFWARSMPVSVLGVPTHALGPADALLHTIVHGMRYNEEPTLRWIADAMAILHSRHPLDWAVLADESRRRGVGIRMQRALDYLRRTYDAPIPDAAWRALAAGPRSRLERLEFRYVARHARREQRESLSHLATMVALEYLRVSSGKGPRRALAELPGFLRYRLRGRTEPALLAGRALARLVGLGRREHGGPAGPRPGGTSMPGPAAALPR